MSSAWRPALQDRTDRTRRQLILAGIELYARHGIEGVSLRSVNERAGSKNRAAAHYHFKTKEAFVSAIVEFMFDIEQGEIDAFVDQYGRALRGVEAEFFQYIAPILIIDQNRRWGRAGIRFLANLTLADPKRRSKIWTSTLVNDGEAFIDALGKHLPGADRDGLKLGASFALVNVIFGLAGERAMANTVFGDLSRLDETHQFAALVSYCASGIVAAAETSLQFSKRATHA